MTGEDQNKIIEKTENQLEYYKSNISEKIIVTETEMIAKYPYRTTKIQPPPVTPETFGFTDRYFGGNIYKIARVYNSAWHLLVDKNERTLALYVPGKFIHELKLEELKWILKKYKMPFEYKISKVDAVKILTERFE